MWVTHEAVELVFEVGRNSGELLEERGTFLLTCSRVCDTAHLVFFYPTRRSTDAGKAVAAVTWWLCGQVVDDRGFELQLLLSLARTVELLVSRGVADLDRDEGVAGVGEAFYQELLAVRYLEDCSDLK